LARNTESGGTFYHDHISAIRIPFWKTKGNEIVDFRLHNWWCKRM